MQKLSIIRNRSIFTPYVEAAAFYRVSFSFHSQTLHVCVLSFCPKPCGVFKYSIILFEGQLYTLWINGMSGI